MNTRNFGIKVLQIFVGACVLFHGTIFADETSSLEMALIQKTQATLMQTMHAAHLIIKATLPNADLTNAQKTELLERSHICLFCCY